MLTLVIKRKSYIEKKIDGEDVSSVKLETAKITQATGGWQGECRGHECKLGFSIALMANKSKELFCKYF